MTPFRVVRLSKLTDTLGKPGTEKLLASFECPLNPDIEHFARERSIDFSQRGIAQTHLVLARGRSGPELVGFFTLTLKVLSIPVSCMSNTMRKKYLRFGALDETAGVISLAAPLIAQLGRNYSPCITQALSGNLLIAYACEMVRALQEDLGGRLVYLECEPKGALISFYERNGFRRAVSSGGEVGLIQMVRFQ